MGFRLQTAMASGSIDEDGTVHWLSCGPYDCTFQESKLVNVLHRPSGDSVVVDPNEYVVSGAWTAIDFWHELTAGFQFQKQAPLVLCDLFDKVPAPMGPWKFTHFSGSKQQAFLRYVEQQVLLYVAEKNNLNQDGSEASKVVAELRKEKHDARLSKAREAAATAHTQAKVLRKATCASKAKAKANAKAAGEEIAD